MTSIPFLATDGDAHACGLAHGRRFAREIADNVVTYLRRFAVAGLDRDMALAEAATWRRAIAEHNPSYSEEMQGIAEGSGQGEEMIALLNARYELAFTLFGQEAIKQAATQSEGRQAAAEALLAAGPDGCTTFGLLPTATADGHTWLGQNWDWLEGVHGRTFVLQARRKSQPSFVCLTEAGIAGGKMGVNECGIGLVENGLASSHDGRNPYQKPFHVRCREVLGAQRFEQATRPVTDSPRTCSANFVIGAAGGEIVDLEFEPRSRQRASPRRRRRDPFESFPGAGTWRVAAGENLSQHALSRRPHANLAGGGTATDIGRAHARGGRRPFRRPLRHLPPPRCEPAAGYAHDDRRCGAHRPRGANAACG